MKTTISWLSSAILVTALAGAAYAQPEDGMDDPMADDTMADPMADETTPEDTGFGESEPSDSTETTMTEETAPSQPVMDDASGYRPQIKGLGIGLGYVFPGADIQQPNFVSARFVLGPKLAVEANFEVSFNKSTISMGGADASTTDLVFGTGAELHYSMYTRGQMDLSGVGAAGINFSSNNPEGNDNNSSSLAFGLSWGLRMDYYLKRNWGLAFQFNQPLFSLSRDSQQVAGADDNTSTDTFFGLLWSDTFVRTQLFVYF